MIFIGSLNENRTRDSALRGRRLNLLTIRPSLVLYQTHKQFASFKLKYLGNRIFYKKNDIKTLKILLNYKIFCDLMTM